MAYKPSKLGHTDPVWNQSSSVGLYMQDYRFTRAVVMICVTLVNTQTDSF